MTRGRVGRAVDLLVAWVAMVLRLVMGESRAPQEVGTVGRFPGFWGQSKVILGILGGGGWALLEVGLCAGSRSWVRSAG